VTGGLSQKTYPSTETLEGLGINIHGPKKCPKILQKVK